MSVPRADVKLLTALLDGGGGASEVGNVAETVFGLPEFNGLPAHEVAALLRSDPRFVTLDPALAQKRACSGYLVVAGQEGGPVAVVYPTRDVAFPPDYKGEQALYVGGPKGAVLGSELFGEPPQYWAMTGWREVSR